MIVTTMNRFSAIGILFLLQWIQSNGTPIATSLSTVASMMPNIESVEVKCGRSGMNVHMTFDRPFPGVIYSKGQFYDPHCNYVTSSNTGGRTFGFLIPVDSCGTEGHLNDPTPERDMYYENTIIIQNDPLIQEVWDVAKKLKCTWKHTFSKSVRTNPISIESPKMVKVDFDSRSVNTLMQIQKGKSPFSAPATGYIYVGDDTSLVIYLQDSSGELDANAVSCRASSPKDKSVELVDKNGCLVRPNLMTPFAKLKNPEGVEADLMLYSYFKAFRVGDDPNFKITCQLEVCEGSCLDPCALGPYAETKRTKREVDDEGSKNKLITIEHGAIIIGKAVEVPEKEKSFSCNVSVDSSMLSPLMMVMFLSMASILALLLFLYGHSSSKVRYFEEELQKKKQSRRSGQGNQGNAENN